jgi:hypothetical protein
MHRRPANGPGRPFDRDQPRSLRGGGASVVVLIVESPAGAPDGDDCCMPGSADTVDDGWPGDGVCMGWLCWAVDDDGVDPSVDGVELCA